jgi:uncharacterized protein
MSFTLKNTFIILFLWLLLTFLSLLALPNMRFSYDVERFFNKNDSELIDYLSFRERFENDNDFVLIGIRNTSGIFRKDFLQKTDSLTYKLAQLQNILKVQSPVNISEPVFTGLQYERRKLIDYENDSLLNEDSVRIFNSAFWSASFFSKDRHSLIIHLKKKEGTSRAENEALYYQLTILLNKFKFNEYHLAGRIRTQHHYVNGMFAEMSKLGLLSLVILITVVAVLLRWIWAVLIVPLIMASSVAGTLAIVSVYGEQINLIMVLMPLFIIVTGMSAGIHLMSRYRAEYKLGYNKEKVVNYIFKEVGGLNFIATLTTAIGFFSLYLMPSEPVKVFGIYTGAGVLYTYFISSLVVPAVLRLLPVKPRKSQQIDKPEFSTRIWTWLSASPKKVVLICVLICIVLALPALKLKLNTHFLDDVNKSSDLYRDLQFFEKEFSGIRPLEISIKINAPSITVLSLPVLKKIDSLEDFLKREFGAGFILSPVTIVKTARKAKSNGNEKGYRLPPTEEGADELAEKILTYTDSTSLYLIISKDLKYARLSAKMPDLGSAIMNEKRKRFDSFVAANIPATLAEVKLTGAAILMDKAGDSIAGAMVSGILLNLVLFFIIIFGITRNLFWSLVSLIPNVLPLLVCGGIMGIAGIELKAFTSVVFTIILGIAVDDTVHIIGKTRNLMDAGYTQEEALHLAWMKLFRPVIYTSLSICSGFLILVLSEFPSSTSLGILISASLLLAMLLDLLLTPALYLIIIKLNSKTKDNAKYDT